MADRSNPQIAIISKLATSVRKLIYRYKRSTLVEPFRTNFSILLASLNLFDFHIKNQKRIKRQKRCYHGKSAKGRVNLRSGRIIFRRHQPPLLTLKEFWRFWILFEQLHNFLNYTNSIKKGMLNFLKVTKSIVGGRGGVN